MSRPFVRNRQTALLAGACMVVAGSFLLYDAYEGRGRQRPWGMKWIPGA